MPQVMNAHRSKILFFSHALPSGVIHGTDASATVREDPDRMQATLRLGLGNVLIMPDAFSKHRGGLVIRRPRLGGLLNYYERAAA